MTKEWITGTNGHNLKFKRETLLNYGLNRWKLNQASSVGPTSSLIRACAPNKFDEWEQYYFDHAIQKKRNGSIVTRDHIIDLGQRLYIKLSEVVQNELGSIQEEECIQYVYNLVLNRTYEGYRGEIDTIYGQLQSILGIQIDPAPDRWDRTYMVDFCISVGSNLIGLQIKPIESGRALDYYQWDRLHEENHARFKSKYGGTVFFVYSVKLGNKKVIYNPDVIEEIRKEIHRLDSGTRHSK